MSGEELKEKIESCSKNKKCPMGLEEEINPPPIVCEGLENAGSIRYMVITEQGMGYVGKCRDSFNKGEGTPQRLERLLRDSFKERLGEEWYWTHLIKCPIKEGKKRKEVVKKVEKKLKEGEEGCISFLREEIKILQPKKIFVFGNLPLFWFEKKYEEIIDFGKGKSPFDKRDKRDRKIVEITAEELTDYLSNKKIGFPFQYKEGKNGRIIFLPHPSRKNFVYDFILKLKERGVFKLIENNES